MPSNRMEGKRSRAVTVRYVAPRRKLSHEAQRARLLSDRYQRTAEVLPTDKPPVKRAPHCDGHRWGRCGGAMTVWKVPGQGMTPLCAVHTRQFTAEQYPPVPLSAVAPARRRGTNKTPPRRKPVPPTPEQVTALNGGAPRRFEQKPTP